MTQHSPAHDETVRLPADGASGRPRLADRRPAAPQAEERHDDAGWPDDTRPVTRDWLRGAPADPPAPADGDQQVVFAPELVERASTAVRREVPDGIRRRGA